MRRLASTVPTIIFAGVFAAQQIGAQQIGQNRPGNAQDNYTLSVKVQLVVEAVVVKDRQGNPIRGLTANDFTVTEDNAPQTIKFFEHQDLAANAKPLPDSKRADENLKIYKRLARERIAPETTENERYKNRRLLALYFDMSAMRPADQIRALQAAEKFIRTQMTSVDLVAIMRYNAGSVDILQDFTTNRDRLLSILETMIVGEGQDSAEEVDDASSSDTGAAFGQDDSEFNIFNTDRQLSALQTAARMLGQLNEKKSLIYFAGGLRLNGVDNQAQLHATVDAAIKAGVLAKRGKKWVIRKDFQRRLLIYSERREYEITVGRSRTATLVGKYMAGVRWFLQTNDVEHLKPFVGKSVRDISGQIHALETRPNVLHRLANSSASSFEQVYRIVI